MLGGFKCAALGGFKCSMLGGFKCAALGGVKCSMLGGFKCAALGGVKCSMLGGFKCAALGGVKCSMLGGFKCAALGGFKCSMLGGAKASSRAKCSRTRASCVTIIKAALAALASRFKSSTTCAQRRSSNAEVGSSANSSAGWLTIALAMEARCFSPALKVCGGRSRTCLNSNRSASSSNTLRSTGRPAHQAAAIQFSRTVRLRTKCGCWNTSPIWRPRQRSRSAAAMRSSAFPPSNTDPCCGVSSPASRWSKVVLPQPLSPVMSSAVPASTATSGKRMGEAPGYR